MPGERTGCIATNRLSVGGRSQARICHTSQPSFFPLDVDWCIESLDGGVEPSGGLRSRCLKFSKRADEARRPGCTLARSRRSASRLAKGPDRIARKKQRRYAAQRVLGGASICGVVIDWNAHDLLTPSGNRWRSETVERLLLQPSLAGIRHHEPTGAETEAVWQPIITREEHDLLKLLARSPSQARPARRGDVRLTEALGTTDELRILNVVEVAVQNPVDPGERLLNLGAREVVTRLVGQKGLNQ